MGSGRNLGRLAVLAAVIALTASACATCPCDNEPVDPAAPVVDDAVDPGWEYRFVDQSIDAEFPEPFVRLVDLSRLRIGMTKAEVLAIFPDPDRIALRQGDDVWQYGFAELLFRNDLLRAWFEF